MVYVLAVFASICGATGAALQHREVGQVPQHKAGGLSLVWNALRRPGWLLGFAVFLGAFGFQFAALKVGDLIQVQPMLTTELLFLLGIITLTHHQRPSKRDFLGAACIVVGLGGFLVAAHPHGGSRALSTSWVLVLSAAAVLCVLVLIGLSRLVEGWAKAAMLGAAAASCFAYQASMTKVLGGLSPSKIPLSPALWGLAVGGTLGFVLFQHALRAGHVAASRASMAVVNPLLSVVIGLVAFGEVLSSSPGRIVVELLGLFVLLFGARQLATSPLITEAEAASGDPTPGDQAPGDQAPGDQAIVP